MARVGQILQTGGEQGCLHASGRCCSVPLKLAAVRERAAAAVAFGPGSMTPCLVCAAPCDGPRCRRCEADRQRRRNAARADRYGAEHRAERKRWEPIVATGTVECARCNKLIRPGQEWALDHLERRDRITGKLVHVRSHPSHARHNSGARVNRR